MKSERVFPDDRHDVGYSIQYVWKRAREYAELPRNARIHDLRHTRVTRGLAANFTYARVGKAVGHASDATTRRYTHLSLTPVRAVTEHIGAEIAAQLRNQSSGGGTGESQDDAS